MQVVRRLQCVMLIGQCQLRSMHRVKHMGPTKRRGRKAMPWLVPQSLCLPARSSTFSHMPADADLTWQRHLDDKAGPEAPRSIL